MGKSYRHPAMKQLKDQQTRYALRDRRLEQVERAEHLLGEIEGAKRYPYEYLCFRITGYRPDAWPALVLEGGDVQHDLRLFVEDLSATAHQAVEQVEEPVLTVDEVSQRYNVSPRTVTRWRRQGLVGRRFLIGGRTKVGFLESSLQRFVTAHRAQVERGSRFRQLTEAERDEIIRRARRMALVRPEQAGLVEIARRIARKMSRSTETIRLTLKAHDRDHPDRAIFPNSASPLDDEAKADFLRVRMGVSAEVLARQYGRTRSSIYRVINEMRARRILSTKLEFIDNGIFSQTAAAAEIMGPMPDPPDGKAPRRPKAPKGLPPYLASLYEVPLLDRDQEMHLFRKIELPEVSGSSAPFEGRSQPCENADLDEIERLQEDALAVKNQVIRANLRHVGARQAKARIAPTAPASSEACSLSAAPTMTWNPASFWRVFILPTIVIADDDGFASEGEPVDAAMETSSPPSAPEPAVAAASMRGVTASNVSVTVALRCMWRVPATILRTFSTSPLDSLMPITFGWSASSITSSAGIS